MTVLPSGPTATQLHARTLLREEEEPRTNKPGGLAVPTQGSSSSANSGPTSEPIGKKTA